MFKTGPANKRKGIKTNPKPNAPHPKKDDNKFGSKTNYGDIPKIKIGLTGGKKK